MHFFKFKESYSIRKFKAKDMYPRNTRYPNRLVLKCTPKTTLCLIGYSMCVRVSNKVPACIRISRDGS